MKILYVVPGALPMGVERQALLMILGHNRARFEPVVLLLSPGPLVARLRSHGISVYAPKEEFSPNQPWRWAPLFRMVKSIATKEKPSLVHSLTPTAHFIGAKAARALGIPSIHAHHRPREAARSGFRWHQADLHVTASQYLKDLLPKRHRVLSEVLLNATELASTPQDMDRFRTISEGHLGIPPQCTVIGLVTSLAPGRGLETILSAISPLALKDHSIRLLVVGGTTTSAPDFEREVRNTARDEGIEERVLLTGFQEELAPLIARMDVFVEPASVPHGFGLPLIEAMAMGRPVIAPRLGGPLEIVTDGVDGIFHTAGDAFDLSQRLRDLIENGDLRKHLGVAAKATVEKQFRPPRLIAQLEATYERLLRGAH